MEEKELLELKDMWLAEMQEYLLKFDSFLVALEKDPKNREILKEISRIVHTLKGMGAVMEYNKIIDLTHKMEDLLDKLKKDEIEINQQIIDIFFTCFDNLAILAREIKDGKDKVDIKLVISNIDDIIKKQLLEDSVSKEIPETEPHEVHQPKTLEVQKAVKSETVRVRIEYLDKIVNLVGELVVLNRVFSQLATKYEISELQENMKQFEKILLELQDEILKTRNGCVGAHIFTQTK